MEEGKKKKIKNMPLFVVICACLALAGYFVGGYVAKQFNKTTTKDTFVNAFEDLFSGVTVIDTKEFDTLSDTFSIKANVKSSLIDSDIINLINKLNVSGKLDVDLKNETLYLNIDSEHDSEDLINGSIYLDNDQVYLFLKDIYIKCLILDISNLDFSDYFDIDSVDLSILDITVEDVTDILEEVKDALLNSLKDDYFTKEKEDGLTKITLTIDGSNIKNIIIDFLDNLKDSKTFKKTVSKVVDLDMDYIVKEAKASLKQVDDEYLDEMGSISLSIYKDKKDDFKKANLEITAMTDDEKRTIKVEVEKEDSENIKIVGYYNGIGVVTIKLNAVQKGDTQTLKIDVSVPATLSLTLEVEETVKYDVKLDKVDVSNSVNISDLSEYELESIGEKLASNEAIQEIIEIFNSYNYSYNNKIDYYDYYNDDYDYDYYDDDYDYDYDYDYDF